MQTDAIMAKESNNKITKMDYKYIEQLLESYFNCTATLQEEQILKAFFSQEDVPGHLSQYADLFRYESEAKADGLDENFDKHMMKMIERQDANVKKARIISINPRCFAPFFKAAAVVAIALTIGRAAEHAIGEHEAEDKNAIATGTYIRTDDVQQIIRVKDVNQAEMKSVNDSIITVKANEGVQ